MFSDGPKSLRWKIKVFTSLPESVIGVGEMNREMVSIHRCSGRESAETETRWKIGDSKVLMAMQEKGIGAEVKLGTCLKIQKLVIL